MAHAPQIKIPATYMRGGTSKGVFFFIPTLSDSSEESTEEMQRKRWIGLSGRWMVLERLHAIEQDLLLSQEKSIPNLHSCATRSAGIHPQPWICACR